MLWSISAIGIGRGDSWEDVVIGPKSDASPLPKCFGFSVFSVIVSLLLKSKFSLCQPWLQVISNTIPIEVFIKYFGVCSVNSPVLPDKIAHCEKNVSRETFAMGSRLYVPAALWLSNSPLSCVARIAWLPEKQHLGFAVAGGQLLDTGYAYALGQWKMGIAGDTIKFLLFFHYHLSERNNKLEIAWLHWLHSLLKPTMCHIATPWGRQARAAIMLYYFNSNPVPYLADDMELWFRMFADFTRIERAVAILIAMANVMNEQRIFHRAVFHVKHL